MKVLASLPPKRHFREIYPVSQKYAHVFEAKATSRFRIYSPIPDPWLIDEWAIAIRESKGKSNKVVYTNRIDLQLSLEEDLDTMPAVFVFEFEKGIAHSNQMTLRFYTFPLEENVNMMVSVCLK